MSNGAQVSSGTSTPWVRGGPSWHSHSRNWWRGPCTRHPQQLSLRGKYVQLKGSVKCRVAAPHAGMTAANPVWPLALEAEMKVQLVCAPREASVCAPRERLVCAPMVCPPREALVCPPRV